VRTNELPAFWGGERPSYHKNPLAGEQKSERTQKFGSTGRTHMGEIGGNSEGGATGKQKGSKCTSRNQNEKRNSLGCRPPIRQRKDTGVTVKKATPRASDSGIGIKVGGNIWEKR